MAVDVGTTTSLQFVTSALLVEVVGIQIGGISRPAIDTTHLLSTLPVGGQFGGRTFIPGKLQDPGELTLEIHHDPDKVPPVNTAPEQLVLTFPVPAGKTVGAKYTMTGFCTAYQAGTPLEDKMGATITVKLSGVVVPTAAS